MLSQVVKEATDGSGDNELRWVSAEDMVVMQMRFWALRYSDAVFLVEEISKMNFAVSGRGRPLADAARFDVS